MNEAKLYGIIYTNGKDFLYAVVKATSHFHAEEKASKDVQQYEGFHVFAVNYLTDAEVLDSGAVVFVGG